MKIKAPINRYCFELGSFLLTGTLSTLILCYGNLRFPNDDQFILYRYIDNIAFGHGFVFNLGEKVLGSTTPLFTLVAALLKSLLPFINTPNLVAGLNILFFSLAAVPFYRLARRVLSSNWALLAVIIWSLNLSRMIPEGMETPFFLLIVLCFLELLFSDYYKSSAVFLALAVLIRPDAGLIAVLTAFYWWQKKGFKQTVFLTFITVLVSLPWFVFSGYYFGTIIPQSLATKIHSNDIVFQTNYQALKVQLSHLSRIYWGRIFDPDNIIWQIIINLFPFLTLTVIGVYKKINKDNWLMIAIPLAYLVSFSISNPVMFPWYLSEVEPFWIILSLVGLEFLFGVLKTFWLKVALLSLVVLGPFSFWFYYLTTDSTGTKNTLFVVGEYLVDKVKPNESIGLSNIGIVGYITGARIEDFIGLINTDAVSYYPTARDCLTNDQLYVIPPALIKTKTPVWLVVGDGEMDRCFVEGDWLKNNYRLDKRYGSVSVYHKK